MNDEWKKYPENFEEPEDSVTRCPMCGAEVKEGQIFCIECGTDLRKAIPEINDVYNGPEFYEKPAEPEEPEKPVSRRKMPKDKKPMGKVYAGPEYFKRSDPEPMEMLYAGPEYFNKPDQESMAMAYAGPEFFNGPRPTMGPVYAGPDIMSGVYAGPVNANGVPVNEELKDGPAEKEDLKKKIGEPSMKALYDAPRRTLAQKIKEKLTK